MRSLGMFSRKKAKNTSADTLQNEYYEDVSAGLGILQVILYLSLFAFVVISFLSNTNLITYQNFYHFFKDLNASAENTDVFSGDYITYPASDTQSFTLYRRGLAVAGNRSVTVFSATGRQTVSVSVNYQNPVAVGSGKYLLVYELGGTQYSLYNSYTQLFSGKSDFPLYGATVSDNGTYALISTSDTYPSVVSFYNNQFALVGRYSKTGYVMDVAINKKGSQIALVMSNSEEGRFHTVAECYEKGKDNAFYTASVSSSMALSCAFTDSEMLAVLCSDGIYYISSSGNVELVQDLRGTELSHAVLDSNGVAVCIASSTISEKNRIIVFDKSGKMLYNEIVTENVEELARYQRTIYYLSADHVNRLDVQSGEVLRVAHNTRQCQLLAINENEALLCSSQKADYISFD